MAEKLQSADRLRIWMRRATQIVSIFAMLMPAIAVAQEADAAASDPGLPSVWDLKLGSHAREMPLTDFIDYACGTNGGPPSLPIQGWTEYTKCTPEAGTGYREVYFEYDDELEYRGRARHLDLQIARYRYTWVNEVPVIASALFDADGFYVGLRLVTDPRVELSMREMGMTLGGFMFVRFGQEGWSCTDLPRLEGELEYAENYIKRLCTKRTTTKDMGEVDLSAEIHNFRRKGQAGLSRDNIPTQGEFESSTRFEVRLVNPIPDREARLAKVRELGPVPVDPVIAKAFDCPGCDLHGANLKRANLKGAKLAGANLAGANLHGAILNGADLSGANLSGADINRAELRAADLHNADLQGAMLFGSALDGANLAGANMSGGMLSSIRLSSANLSGAIMQAADLRDARLNDANFTGADLRGSWMHNAQVTRANMSKANMINVLALGANMSGVDFTGADARGVDFFGANLRDANLTSADFSYSRMTQVNLFATTLTGAKFIESAMPAGFKPAAEEPSAAAK